LLGKSGKWLENMKCRGKIRDALRIEDWEAILVKQDLTRPEKCRSDSRGTAAGGPVPGGHPPSDQPGLTVRDLLEIVPKLGPKKAATLLKPLQIAMMEAQIDTPARQAAFLAQLAHETGGFKWFRELGPDTYFEKYEGREDLGNTEEGDGLRFKGRGFIQITGRANYTRAGKALGLDLVSNPTLAETPEVGARVAAWYWSSRNLNKYADRGDFITLTRRINGGLQGLRDRQTYYARAKKALGAK
jgi:putative chitinase